MGYRTANNTLYSLSRLHLSPWDQQAQNHDIASVSIPTSFENGPRFVGFLVENNDVIDINAPYTKFIFLPLLCMYFAISKQTQRDLIIAHCMNEKVRLENVWKYWWFLLMTHVIAGNHEKFPFVLIRHHVARALLIRQITTGSPLSLVRQTINRRCGEFHWLPRTIHST